MLQVCIIVGWLAGHAAARTFKVVRTPLGSVTGVDYGDFVAFKGLPYAEPPRRFFSPEAKRPWPSNHTWDATRFGDACMGGGSRTDEDPLESYGESEDCLFANVWVPKASRAQDLPVVVWIHGGGFIVRTGSYPGYWGDGFVTEADAPPAVLVTFNYRLAVFGFYSSADAGANFGLQDQQLLLRWVRTNIAAFGGDPSRVTLSGQSAGAMSVVCHLAAPASRGLFHRAVASSPVGLQYRSRADNEDFVRTVSKAVGCSWAANQTECLRSAPASRLKLASVAPEYMFNLFSHCDHCNNILPWMPVVDGAVLPLSPVEAFRRGAHHKVPTVLSTTPNETLAFVPTLARIASDNTVGYELLMKAAFRDRAPEVKQHYATSPDTASVADKAMLFGWATTDALMTCYARYVAKLLSQYAPTFLSTFMVAPHSSEMHVDSWCVSGPPHGASCHSADIHFFLPHSARMTHRTGVGFENAQERRIGSLYMATLINFTYGASGPFALYSNDSDTSTVWDLNGSSLARGHHKNHCDFLESVGFPDSPWGSSSEPTATVGSTAGRVFV